MKHKLLNSWKKPNQTFGKLIFGLIFMLISNISIGQTLFDSFTDGEFTSNPAWAGTTTWTVVANSDAAAGATGSNTLRLNATALAATEYLSSPISTWGTDQEWGFFLGRRAQAFTAANQAYFWLYANEATLNNTTVDGYRIAIGDDVGNDDIRLEYVVNGVMSATVILGSTAITNNITDIGILIRVTRNASGVWTLFTSTVPTATGTGAIATGIPNSTNASINLGTGTNSLITPTSGGFIGMAALHSIGANAIISTEYDQIYFTQTSGSIATLSNITTQPSGNIVQGTANTVLAGFRVGSSVSADFSAVTVTGAGSATSTDLTNVRIFRDNDGSGTITGSDASVSGLGIAYGATMSFGITGETGITGTRNYLIVADVAGVGVSTPGNIVTASIAPGAFTTTASTNTGSATGNSRIIAAPSPVITTTGTLTAFSTIIGTPSTSQTYTVSGVNLTNNIVINATPKFEFSLNGTTWTDSTGSITLTQVGGTIATTTIYVRYNPQLIGTNSGTVNNTSIGATTQTVAVSGTAIVSPGPLLYSITGSAYNQTFDGLPATGGTLVTTTLGAGPFYVGTSPVNANGATGWQYGKASGSNADVRFIVDAGSSTTGSIYSYGTGSTADRALGSLSSTTHVGAVGVVIKNTTAVALGNITISFTGEQWRKINTGIANHLLFSYSLNGTSILNGTYSSVNTLDFNSPVFNTSAAIALDGNAAVNRTAVSASLALNGAWIPGSLLILRWTSSGSGDGLAIDDFSFSATAPIAPTTQDNSISFSGTTTVATTVTWVNGDGASHLVKINTTNSFTNPVDLNGYIGNSVYSGSGEQTVYVGTGNTVNISGLAAGTQYFFRAYGYNGTGASSRYNISTATGNPTDVTTLPPSSATKLVIASVNNGSNPIAGQPFSVVVQSRDGANNLQPVGLNTTFTLSTFIGLYALAGTTSGTIIAGTNSIIVTGLIYNPGDQFVQLDATVTVGDPLTSGQSASFDVVDVANALAFGTVPSSGVVNTVVGNITVNAIRPDQSTDITYSGQVTIAVASGPGTISGTLVQSTVNGTATFNNIQFSLPGTYTLSATATGGLTGATSSSIIILPPPALTELAVPQFMGSKSTATAGTNDCRAPFAVCVKIDNLLPNTSYNLIAGLGLTSDPSTSIGAGNFWSVAANAFGTAIISSAFVTNGSGSSGPYWIYFQPTGNASRFGPGQLHDVRLAFSTSTFPNPVVPNVIGTKIIKALDIPTTGLTTDPLDDGAFLKGSSVACAGGKFVLVYDNVAGTGDPLSSYQVRNTIPTNTSQGQLPTAIDDVYKQGGASLPGDYAVVIPIGANNPNGVRRIELRNTNNTIYNFATDADGIWPGGANTTTLARRAVASILPSDAQFNTVSVTATSTPATCLNNNGTATANAVGVGTILYSWNSSPAQTTATATGLVPGNYIVTVSDANGCTASATTTVGAPAAATITAGGPTTFCLGGSVTLSAGSGVSYSWSPNGETTQSIIATTSGSYTVTVNDGGGCTQTSAPVVVSVNTFGFTGALYSENMGNPASTTLANAYTGWQNGIPITYSTVAGSDVDVRTSNASSGYTGSSGTGNAYFSAGAPTTKQLVISGINTLGYSSITLTFGLRRDGGSAADLFTAEYSTNGTTYTAFTFTQPTTNNAWNLISATGSIPATGNLRLRFSKTAGQAFRLDDVKISGTVSTANVAASGPLNLCPGSNVRLSSNFSTNLWSPNGETTKSILVSTAGNYSVIVTSANGCSTSSAVTVVQNVANPTLTTSTTNLSCNVSNDGTATANVITGASPFLYSWNTAPVQTAMTATGLTAGNYVVTVTDANTCSATASAIINQGSASTITPSGATTFCTGGSVTLTAGTGASYSWAPNGQTTQSIVVSTSGSYAVTVDDGAGCIQTSVPTTVTVNSFNYTGVIYSENVGSPIGTTVLSLYSGWQNAAPILYSSTSSPETDVRTTTPSTIYAGASGGGNIFLGNATSSQRDLLISGINTASYSNLVLSFGLLRTDLVDGITVSVSSDGVNYSPLTITQPAVANAWTLTTASGSIPSTSNLRVKFEKANTTSFRIDDIKLSASASSVNITATNNGILCAGTNMVLASNILTNNLWSPNSETTRSIVVTTGGTFSVTATDANGCVATAAPVTVTVVPNVFLSVASTNVTCFGLANGTAEAFVTNGTSPFSFSWNTTPIQTTSTLSALIPGTYSVHLTDANGCTATGSASITEPSKITLTATVSDTIICVGEQVTLSSFGSTFKTYTATNAVPVNVPDSDITGVHPVTSSVLISNLNTTSLLAGSVAQISNVTITSLTHPKDSDLIVRLIAPNGRYLTLVKQRGSGANFTNTQFTPTATTLISGGTSPFTATYVPDTAASALLAFSAFDGINPNGTWQLQVTDNASLNTGILNSWSITFQSPTAWSWSSSPSGFSSTVQSPGLVSPSSLGTGIVTYTAVATNTINGCTASSSIAVLVNPLPATPTASVSSQPTCTNATGTITITAPAGVGYKYSLNGINYSNTTGIFSGLAIGTYSVTAMNSDSCISPSLSLTVLAQPSLTVTGVNPSSGCPGDIVTLTGTYFTNATTVLLNGSAASFTIVSSTEISVTIPVGATSGSFSVTTSDGCSGTSSSSFTVNTCTSGVVLNLKVFMQGYYLGSGMMAPVLANQAVLNATLSEADTVLVQLRDVTDPTIIVDAKSILIMTDGTGTANFTVATPGSYWIVVKHRNSIQTWSAAPVALPATYNFTTAATQAFGGNMVDVNSESIFSMYTGDDNQDDFIDIFDFPDYDLDNQNFVAFEYKATDFNGDGFVDIFDFPVYDLNNQNFVFAITP